MFDSSKARLFLIRPSLKKDSDFDVTLIGGNVLLLCIHFVFWLFILLLIENGVFNCFGRMINILNKNKITPKKDEYMVGSLSGKKKGKKSGKPKYTDI
jgi:hypothetical protein